MLCARCSSPLPHASSRCARCGTLATSGPGGSHVLAMAAVLRSDPRRDTKPELPRVAPDRYDTRPIYRSSLTPSFVPRLEALPSTPAVDSYPTQEMRALAPAQAYTLAHLLDDTFGPNAAPADAIATTRLQGLLLRLLGARRAVTRWLPAATGALVTMLAGLALSLAIQLLWNFALGAALQPSKADLTTGFAERVLQVILGGNPFKLFALANLAPVLLAGTDGQEIVQPHMQLAAPLSAFSLIPVVSLLLGGALAAGSDFGRRARHAVARGALVGPFYAILLMVIALAAGGRIDGRPLGISGSALLVAAPNSALFYGLIWGTLFGALGGWLQFHGRGSLRAALARAAALRQRRLVGSLVGAGVALTTGLLVSAIVSAAVAVFMAISGQTPGPLADAAHISHLLETPAGWLALALLTLAFAPTLALWTWSYATGMPIDIDRVSYAQGGLFGSDFASFGLFGAPHIAWTLLALIPLTCYFLGGRVAARIARANRPGGAFFAGALVALPLTAFSVLLASLSSLGLQANLPIGTLIVDVTPSATRNLVSILLVTALVAGFGGRSAVTRPALGASLYVRLVTPGPARKVFFTALDRLVGRRPRGRLSLPRALAYTGILAACALSLALLALDVVSLTLLRSAPAQLLATLDGAAAALLVVVSLACFAAAACAQIIGILTQAFSAAASRTAPSTIRQPITAIV